MGSVPGVDFLEGVKILRLIFEKVAVADVLDDGLEVIGEVDVVFVD